MKAVEYFEKYGEPIYAEIMIGKADKAREMLQDFYADCQKTHTPTVLLLPRSGSSTISGTLLPVCSRRSTAKKSSGRMDSITPQGSRYLSFLLWLED